MIFKNIRRFIQSSGFESHKQPCNCTYCGICQQPSYLNNGLNIRVLIVGA